MAAMSCRTLLQSGSAVDAASQVAEAVSVLETEHDRQLTQRTGRVLAALPCGDVSADGLATTVAKYSRVDRAGIIPTFVSWAAK